MTQSSTARLRKALSSIAEAPLLTLALILAVPVAMLVAPVWGKSLSWTGWLAARRRMRFDGLIGLGAVLVPQQSRAQYADGVWRGLWRVHSVSVAFGLVQLLPALLALVPAAVASLLFKGTLFLFPHPAGLILSSGVPLAVALLGLTVVGAQTLLALRLLGETGPRYTLGSIFEAAGAAWRATLRDLQNVLGLGLFFLGAALVAAAIGWVSGALAGLLRLGPGGQGLVVEWTGLALVLALFGLVLEGLAQWAEDAEVKDLGTKTDFSFTKWLVAWLTQVFAWLAARGVLAIGIGACLLMGLLTSLAALLTGQNFSSWVGLGWFTVTALVLVALWWRKPGAAS
jgi:hypothetical protein